ncbi:Anthranilate N-benzoyltransferase protein [Dorcoceras hygrometricum]|uniref:Anthranilate N-benzoyltransferase protein n=1 Tax=Dorcoceras hygrometricum TaxID=472368 RepID=A0A2Z7B4A1_9LAMI|nr:Anthranilate N-benzoyltransferase protein [Dorcoceras hygrometricum]
MKTIEGKQIISNEKVYPSFPTPQNLQTYKFSMIDQIVGPSPIPLMLFFPGNPESFEARIRLLKDSLSLVLSRFFPLAGRMSEDGQSIDCNDQGVPFIVAKIEGKMISDSMITRNSPSEASVVTRLYPCEINLSTQFGPGDSMAMFQVNQFECGGMAIAMVLCHEFMDGITTGHFVRSWAAAARVSSSESVCPNYIAQSLFPQYEEMKLQKVRPSVSIVKDGKSVVRRFVFDSSAINILKEKSLVERPTRVEVVSAFMWKCFMVASLANNKSVSVVTHAVDLRKRSRPQFAPDCLGNLFAMAAAACTNQHETELGHLVRKIRSSVSMIDGDYVARMLGDQGFLGYLKNLENTWSEVPNDADLLFIVSWCNLGIFKADFGWGNPIWIDRCLTSGDLVYMNGVWLVETGNGDGIEAWVTLGDKYMQEFEKIDELQALASIDPQPITCTLINGLC